MQQHHWFSKWYILPVIVLAMLSVLAIGFTVSSFQDSEISNSNSSSAWTSTQWTQTSQADFNNGVLSNVNITLSSGDVIMNAGNATGANMTLFWDGATAPTGWTIVSDVGGPFYQKFPRGEAAAAYGTTGGSDNHTHTATFATSSTPSGTAVVSSGTGITGSSPTHTHTVASSTISVASNLPPYQDLKVIKYNTGVPSTIPAGAIAIFDTSTLPGGWTRYTSADGKYVRAAGDTSTGGSATHTHTVTLTTSGPSATAAAKGTAAINYATSTHTHTAANGNVTNAANNAPPYLTVVLAQTGSNTTIPVGMIAMFDASPTGDWSVLSNSGGAFYRVLLMGGSSYGAGGGSEAGHSHNDLTITLSTPSATLANGKGTGTTVANDTHTHTIAVTGFSTVTNMPPYINVVFAKAIYASSGTIASQVLDTNVTGSRWDGLARNATLPASTNITFEVRASDISFLADNTTLAWTSIGGTSPVISGLSSGRYKQWRATLTTTNVTQTPVLNDVRTYYYGG